MLWQNEPTVVVGKHQNALAEINSDFLSENQIKVARRLSGGGTVYHDYGNLNFTYIINSEEGKMVDFGRYTKDIVLSLNQLGVPAQINKRHDLVIDGKKISGNAEHIFKKRVLHHGTLLFDSDLDKLEKAITPPLGKYTDKAVKSFRSKVCNISPYLDNAMTVSEFKQELLGLMLEKNTETELLTINPAEIDEVLRLSEEKYSTWDWIYGYSPLYEVNNELETDLGKLLIHIVVKKGRIVEAEIGGNLFESGFNEKISKFLINLEHHKKYIFNQLVDMTDSSVFGKYSVHDFVNLLF